MDVLLTLVIYVMVGGLVAYLLWWLIGFVGLPAPFDKVARVVIAVVAVIFLCWVLLSLLPGTGVPVLRR
jgi:hypothetical protein